MKKALFWQPFGRPMVTGGRGAVVRRVVWGVAYRLAVLPVILTIAWVAAVLAVTHPSRHQPATLPDQFSLLYENVSFTSADGVDLSGWYATSFNISDAVSSGHWKKLRPAVVICHDYGAARDQCLYPVATELLAGGYDVLLFDFRGHGRSSSAPVSYGVTEAADVIAAVEFLQRRPGVDGQRIGVFGTGMGAYAAMLAAPRCREIRCVVGESLYPSVDSALRGYARDVHLPTGLGTLMGWGLDLYFGHRLVDYTAVDAAAAFGECGVLLVNGAEDRRTPVSDLAPILSAGRQNAASMVVARAGHGEALKDPATMKMVVKYFDGYLREPKAEQPEKVTSAK